jgi:hypothetical protein
MTTTERPRVPTAVLLVGVVLMSLAALSGRIASPLARDGALPEWLGWLVWPRGPGAIVRSVGVILALGILVWLAVRLVRPRWVAVPAVGVAALAALWAPSLPYPGAQALFASMRPHLDEIRALPVVTQPDSGTRHVDLPRPLKPIAVDGHVSTDGAGGVFVPQWAALVDDAGGFWFTPGTSPEGRDMRGMTCHEPTRLDGDWWVCGMDVEPGGTL